MEVEQHAQVPDGWEVVAHGAGPVGSTDELLAQAHIAAMKGDHEAANAAFFQIPPDERKARGLYAGPGGADPVASGSAAGALGGAGLVAGVGRAILGGGPSLAGKAIAGAKASVAAATPIVKYEATKTILEKLGIPSGPAAAIAMAVSSYKKGAPAAGPSVAAEAAAPAEAAATVTAAPAPSMAGAGRATAPAAPAPATARVAGSLRPDPNPVIQKLVDQLRTEGGLTESEAEQTYRWIAAGVQPKVAWQRIQDARALQQTTAFGKLPTNADVQRTVVDRNTSGRWPE